MFSGESRFNVSLIVRGKVIRQRPQIKTFEEKGDPERIRTEVPLLTSLTARPNRLTRERSVSTIVSQSGIFTPGLSEQVQRVERDVIHAADADRQKLFFILIKKINSAHSTRPSGVLQHPSWSFRILGGPVVKS